MNQSTIQETIMLNIILVRFKLQRELVRKIESDEIECRWIDKFTAFAKLEDIFNEIRLFIYNKKY